VVGDEQKKYSKKEFSHSLVKLRNGESHQVVAQGERDRHWEKEVACLRTEYTNLVKKKAKRGRPGGKAEEGRKKGCHGQKCLARGGGAKMGVKPGGQSRVGEPLEGPGVVLPSCHAPWGISAKGG